MPKNIEIKARIDDWERLRALAESLSDSAVEVMDQEDIFFSIDHARLKLRIFGDDSGELIHYRREDSAAPRPSRYLIAPTTDPNSLRAILSAVFAVQGTVRKRRFLYRAGQTRIHLDRVERLGDFLELEVVLEPDQSEERGASIALELMSRLEITQDSIVQNAYIDLLTAKEKGGAVG